MSARNSPATSSIPPFDPAAVALLARFPTPTNLTAAANNYTRTANDADHQSQFDARVDGAFRSNDRAFGRYSYYNEVEQPVTPLPDGSGLITGSVIGTGGVAGLSNVLGQQAVFNETHTFSARLLNDLRLGYTRRGNTILGTTLGNTASTALGIPGIPTNAAFNNALPLFTFTGFQQLGPSASTFSQYQTAVWQLVDSLVFTRGPHTFKTGADLRWYQLNAVAPPNPTGSFAFTTTGTNQQGVTNSGNAIASFLLGQVDTFQIDLQENRIRPRDHIEEYFVQDDWKLTDRLTANIGARWTLHFPSVEKNNQGAVFNLGTQQLDYLGVNGNSPQRPRASLRQRRAARWFRLPCHAENRRPLRLRHRLHRSVRHHHALHHAAVSLHPERPAEDPGQPERRIRSFQRPLRRAHSAHRRMPALARASTPPIAPPAPATSQQWNLAVQREIINNLSVEFAYVGSHIVHAGIPDSNLNQLTAAQLAQGASLLTPVTNPYYGQLPISSSIGGKTVSAAQLLKPYPRFLNVATYRHNSGETNYNAGQVKVEQRFSNGLALLFAYTHSRLIDDASAVFSTTVLSSPNSSSLIAADTFRPRLERDVSSGDMPNVTTFSGIYDLPAGHGHRFALNGSRRRSHSADGTLNSILSVQSGMPVTVTQATNNNAFAGFALQRPNLVAQSQPRSRAQRIPAHYFNTAAFATAPQFTLGTASRNPVRGPAYRDLDLALVKHIHLFRETGMEFRGEIFNILNTPEFAQPNGSFGAAAFGSITSTVTDPRVVQFAIRLSK